MHTFFAAAPSSDTLAPHLCDLQVKVATLKCALSLLPLVVVRLSYLLNNPLGFHYLAEALDHGLLLA